MQPPVGQLPTLCIPASESSPPCWYALHGVLIPVTMIGAPTARSADLPATTLYVHHRLHFTFALVPLHTHTQRAASAPRLTVQCTGVSYSPVDVGPPRRDQCWRSRLGSLPWST